jgi:hypothetical protein
MCVYVFVCTYMLISPRWIGRGSGFFAVGLERGRRDGRPSLAPSCRRRRSPLLRSRRLRGVLVCPSPSPSSFSRPLSPFAFTRGQKAIPVDPPNLWRSSSAFPFPTPFLLSPLHPRKKHGGRGHPLRRREAVREVVVRRCRGQYDRPPLGSLDGGARAWRIGGLRVGAERTIVGERVFLPSLLPSSLRRPSCLLFRPTPSSRIGKPYFEPPGPDARRPAAGDQRNEESARAPTNLSPAAPPLTSLPPPPSLPHPPTQVNDIALEDYIAVKPKFAVYVPHTAGRYQRRRFHKAQCPIVER